MEHLRDVFCHRCACHRRAARRWVEAPHLSCPAPAFSPGSAGDSIGRLFCVRRSKSARHLGLNKSS